MSIESSDKHYKRCSRHVSGRTGRAWPKVPGRTGGTASGLSHHSTRRVNPSSRIPEQRSRRKARLTRRLLPCMCEDRGQAPSGDPGGVGAIHSAEQDENMASAAY